MVNRILCCLTLSLLLGVLYGRAPSPFIAAGMLVFAAYLAVMAKRRSQGRAWLAVILRSAACLLCFFAGAGRIAAAQECFERPEAAFSEGDRVTVQGQVSKIEEREEQFIYHLKDAQFFLGGKAYPSFGILIYSSNVYEPGNVLQVTGAYAPFQISRNEGNFNEKHYYRSKKLGFRIYAQQETVVSRKRDGYGMFLSSMQRELREALWRSMPQRHAGVMADMALGDKSLLDREVKELYQSAGISHILAISGLHISLLGMGVFRLLRRLRFPQALASLLSVGMVCSFGMLSGMEVSTARAVCMFLLSMAAQASGYSYDTLTALSLSAGIQIWDNPFVLDYAGFLFSYGAVLGVSVVAKAIKEAFHSPGGKQERQGSGGSDGKRLESAWNTLKETLLVSFCIQIATLPLSLYFYYEFSCYSIAVNTCILPFMGLLLFLGICGAFAGCFSPLAGKIILAPAGALLSAQEWVCQKSLSLPGAVLIAGKPGLPLISAYYLVLAAALCALYFRTKRKWLLAIAVSVCFLLFARPPKRFEVDILDVGQGDGVFIQTEEGKHFFIDGGSSDVKQVGKYRILPFLKAKGIRSVAGWIVSHADKDHISGLLEVLEEGYPIECLVLAKGMAQDEAAWKLQFHARKAGCEIVYVVPGARFGTQEAVFTALHPEAGADVGGAVGDGGASADRNGASLALSLACPSFTGVFTGDIGIAQEEEIRKGGRLSQYKLHGIDLYKAAHHGSDGSNSQEFLDFLSPKLTVISCGEGNSYGHPGKEAMDRIAQTGSQILCTMENGQITIKPQEGSLRATAYLPNEE